MRTKQAISSRVLTPSLSYYRLSLQRRFRRLLLEARLAHSGTPIKARPRPSWTFCFLQPRQPTTSLSFFCYNNNSEQASTASSFRTVKASTRLHTNSLLTVCILRRTHLKILPSAATMPNWKTPESCNRLLSALIAAHPELKLDYHEIAAYYGDGCTGSAVDHRLRSVKKVAVEMRLANPRILPSDNGDFSASTKKRGKATTAAARKRAPPKAKAGTSKGKLVWAENDEAMGGEREEDEGVVSPTQHANYKESLRKVSTGRVAKSGAGGSGKEGGHSARGKAQQPDYVEENDEDDESDISVYNDGGQVYKKGDYSGSDYSGQGSREMEEEEDIFVDAEEGS